ncbi:unnamed protein product [Linum trigynum]|uniref:Uncharacterized protein n=1 Tax=Linum trigynum TaxID=586398 RepID=A0AAV2GPC6_9ROSI
MVDERGSCEAREAEKRKNGGHHCYDSRRCVASVLQGEKQSIDEPTNRGNPAAAVYSAQALKKRRRSGLNRS